jgi:peptidoglycan/LPS O-acetylase OafA/YrhL
MRVGVRRGVAINTVGQSAQRDNAFGVMRLALAAMVIVSHTPEIIDGNRAREPLFRIFGTISLGDLAVDGFFLISGFLIAGSYLGDPRPRAYLRRRIARICPGFIVASLVCILIVGPLSGVAPAQIIHGAGRWIARMLLLQRAELDGSFAGSFHPGLNNPMWTIAYEFRCYLLLLGLGMVGMLRRAWLVGVLAAIMLLCHAAAPASFWRGINDLLPHSLIWLGFFDQTLRFTGLFLAGTLFHLWRDWIRFSGPVLLACACGFLICLTVPALTEIGTATFGACLLFVAAFSTFTRALRGIGTRTDLSYGVYLYGWPITKLFTWYWPDLTIADVNILVLATAFICGALSWYLVERPAMRRMRQRHFPSLMARQPPESSAPVV